LTQFYNLTPLTKTPDLIPISQRKKKYMDYLYISQSYSTHDHPNHLSTTHSPIFKGRTIAPPVLRFGATAFLEIFLDSVRELRNLI